MKTINDLLTAIKTPTKIEPTISFSSMYDIGGKLINDKKDYTNFMKGLHRKEIEKEFLNVYGRLSGKSDSILAISMALQKQNKKK